MSPAAWLRAFVSHVKFARAFFAAALIVLAMQICSAGAAHAAGLDKCSPSGNLGPGTGNDLLIDRYCAVGVGTYHYRNVNIVSGGALVFAEKATTLNGVINFWANSILVEYGGYLIAGSASNPFGVNGGTLTFHLYGCEPGSDGKCVPGSSPGAPAPVQISCASNPSNIANPCGIPDAVWSKSCTLQTPPDPSCIAVTLPGGTPVAPVVPPGTTLPPWPSYSDIFYRYESLPYDNINGNLGWFGFKVFAVSEGGTLQLFGKKGAFYGAPDLPMNSGESWVRLDGTIVHGAASLKVATPVPTWKVNDHIVVTTTDYLPDHSEELVITSVSSDFMTFGFTRAPCTDPLSTSPCVDPTNAGAEWTHNGETFSLASIPAAINIKDRSGVKKTAAETRAAVGLLTRSIKIVSEGDAFGECFPPAKADLTSGCRVNDTRQTYYFGGHTIARQGFAGFQVQGVEFRQLGQGGRLAHYPVHMHVARATPLNTFVKDSSVNESMTRWITLHGVSDVLVERNVGYLSIGHGFYLEDAVETNNQLYSNLGIFARAGVTNAQNPRNVPGILADPYTNGGPTKYNSDKDTPAVFWITNGWNDFVGNMAAGAGMCGACFWETPAAMCGPSKKEKWTSYASEQRIDSTDRTGSSPLKNFDGNYCTSAQTSFQTVGYIQNCGGVYTASAPVDKYPVPAGPNVATVPNKLAPPSNVQSPACGPGTSIPICAADYYPAIDDGPLKQGTKCPDDVTKTCDSTNAPLCTGGSDPNCMPSVINNYTSSFHWAPYNFSAVWLRIRWHLFANSFLSDVFNSGLTFISGGDYTRSSAPFGLWDLALQNVFVGHTQPADKIHAFASVLTPFNADTGLQCDNGAPPYNGGYCLSKNNSISIPKDNFGAGQHLFNIYDGPASEQSNAFINITKQPLGVNTISPYFFNTVLGVPKAYYPEGVGITKNTCYMPNAAIAWKQPNGFYYPPNFRSLNLFFSNVDIRHYVVDPQWNPDTYTTNATQAQAAYCQYAPNMFDTFSANDRQTELTDEDGSLTGYLNTTSVNDDAFFTAPIEGPECQSDLSVPTNPPNASKPSPGTAKSSPYSYVTTVVYPDAARLANPKLKSCGDPDWTSRCSNQNCYGVPLYRLYQTGKEKAAAALPHFIRMAGFDICQRQSMSANHGLYYVDLTASAAKQDAWVSGLPPCVSPPPDPTNPPSNCIDRNVFKGGQAYDFFHVFASKDTEQTFKMYVGPGFNPANAVQLVRVDIGPVPFVITPEPDSTKVCSSTSTTCNVQYDNSAILTVKLNLTAYAADFQSKAKALCVPNTFCTYLGGKCVGKTTADKGVFSNLTDADRNLTCAHAGEDVDCPTGGCVGFRLTLPGGTNGFVANNQTTPALLNTLKTCFPSDANWNPPGLVKPASQTVAGSCYPQTTKAPLTTDFCQ
jgi:hypothetical protein